MADRPIIFSARMVRALLEGKKTQTRRVLQPQPDDLYEGQIPKQLRIGIGDRLWVREGFVVGRKIEDRLGRPLGKERIWYRATDNRLTWYDPDTESNLDNPPWRSPIHMPRAYSRMTLTVTEVRVQRVQEISEEDAIAEGWPGPTTELGFPIINPRSWFQGVWWSIHGTDSWEANPWIAAISFTIDQRNIDAEAR